MTVTGTRSGNISSGNLVGGNTGGTFAGKASAAAVIIKLDLPVPRSPATTIRTPFVELAADAPPAIDTIKFLEQLQIVIQIDLGEKVAVKGLKEVLSLKGFC